MSRVRAHLLTVGDELLFGDIVDSNKAWLGRRCRALGVEVVRATTVRDRQGEIVGALHAAVTDGAQVCLISGGLGPTTDDLTAASVAAAAGVTLVRDPSLAARLEAFFSSRGRELLEANLKQADLPAGATVLDNPVGSAAGFAFELGSVTAGVTGRGPGGCWLFSMPGVPHELRLMMREQVEPRVRERFELQPIPRRVYRTLGSGESSVQQNVQGLLAAARERSPGLANMFVHYRARSPEVQLILEATPGPSSEHGIDQVETSAATEAELAQLDGPLREAIGPALYAWGSDHGDNEGPAELAELLVRRLIARGLTIATAESCTGGGIGQAITAIAGSSACFLGGVISYANSVKIHQLGVPADLVELYGAVSEPVARAMAEGARTRLGSDIGVSTTGIAGPGGGTPEKPVGTVDIAVATAAGTTYKRLRLHGKRDRVRYAATLWALKLVWDQLGEPLGDPAGDPAT